MKALAELYAVVAPLGSAVVALSGGVDSALVAACMRQIPAFRGYAVTVDSPLLSRMEARQAKDLAHCLGLPHVFLTLNELVLPDVVENTPDRCFFCKRKRLEALVAWAAAQGIPWVLDGTNADDMKTDRPGLRALAVCPQARSPLAECGWTKDAVRSSARSLGLSAWNRASNACLATRIPFGTPISPELLQRLDKAETLLRPLLPEDVPLRLRIDGSKIRLETVPALSNRFSSPEALALLEQARIILQGSAVVLDERGYRPGGANG